MTDTHALRIESKSSGRRNSGHQTIPPDLMHGVLSMFDNQLLCDVTFRVGAAKYEVNAHRVILASRSAVFEAMFCGPLAQVDEAIDVPDIEPPVMMDLLRYIYAYRCELTEENVAPIAYAARKYAVDDLYDDCIQFAESSIDDDNALAVLQLAHLFDEKRLFQKCLVYVYKHVFEVFEAIGICSSYIIRFLVDSSSVIIIDNDDAFIKWLSELTAVQAYLNKLSDNFQSGQANLTRNLLYLVRMPFMKFSSFLKLIQGTQNKPEEGHILRDVAFNETVRESFLSKYIREKKTIRINRVADPVICNDQSLTSMFISFKTRQEERLSCSFSKPVRLVGVTLFRPKYQDDRCVCNIALLDDHHTCILDVKTNLTYNECERHADIYLPEPVSLSDTSKYTLNLISSGAEIHTGSPIGDLFNIAGDSTVSVRQEFSSIDSISVPTSGIRELLFQIDED